MVSGGRPGRTPITHSFSARALEEGRVVLARDAERAVQLTSCGTALERCTVDIVEPQTRRSCGPGAVGEIWTHGPSVARGYWKLKDATRDTFRAQIERRAAGEPTAYILGQREFYGRPFKVDARVLVPRPETERLVEQVLAAIPEEKAAAVLDLCTGSCCIAATIAAERPQVRAVATDLSADALAVARENVEALGVAARVELRQGDLFAPVGDARFDVVVSNPPYIAEGAFAGLPREVQREPRLALLSGAIGMDAISRIAREAPAHLQPEGLLALEIGDDQKALAEDLLNGLAYRDVKVLADWAGKDRVALARRPS